MGTSSRGSIRQDVPHRLAWTIGPMPWQSRCSCCSKHRPKTPSTPNRMAQELQDAQVVQQTLMPEVRRIARGPLQMCGVYRSASKLSGDWWNHFPDRRASHAAGLGRRGGTRHRLSGVVGAMAYGCASQLYQEEQGNLRPEMLLDPPQRDHLCDDRGKFTMSCFAVIIDTKNSTLTFASGARFPLLYPGQ